MLRQVQLEAQLSWWYASITPQVLLPWWTVDLGLPSRLACITVIPVDFTVADNIGLAGNKHVTVAKIPICVAQGLLRGEFALICRPRGAVRV